MKLNSITLALLFGAAPIAFAQDSNSEEQSLALDPMVITAEALKVETPASESPRALSIISEQELRTRAPQKLDEALRYTSGVTSQPYGADNDTDWFKVRGFDAATYLDGNRLFRDGYYTWLLEPYGLERVEVVKGPAAILFGEAPPGGVVNAVQKKPSDTPQGELHLELGNKNHQAIGFDVSDYANDDGSIRYRLVGLIKQQDGELEQTESQRLYLAPSLSIDVSEATELTLNATYLKDDGTPTNGFFPAAGTLVDSEYGSIDPSTNFGEPGYDDYQRTQLSLGYQLKHDLDAVWRFNQKFNYGYNELTLRSTYIMPSPGWDLADDSLYYKGIVYREGDNQSFSLDNNVVGNWANQQAEHTVLGGVELQYHRTKGVEQDNYSFAIVNPWQPSYGNYTPLDPANNIDRTINKTQASAYGQYQLKYRQQWIALAGLRYDWVSTENSSAVAAQDKSRDDSQLSFNAGLMYLADNGLSPYFSYAQSFEVLSTIDSATGELYKPLEGEQFELGLKYQPAFFDGYFNLALFDIAQKNALVTNPNTWVATQTGEVTSQGLEFDVVAQLNSALQVSANYSFTDAKTDETGGNGTQQAGLIPKHAASLWLDYDAYLLGVEGLNIATGLRYIGESKDNPASSSLTVPSATLWDAAISYQLSNGWDAQLNLNNIMDKSYVSGCDYYCYYGQSRSIMFSTNYRW